MTRATHALYTKPTLSRFVYYKLLTLVPVTAAITAWCATASRWRGPSCTWASAWPRQAS
jgi:hypothetical protein